MRVLLSYERVIFCIMDTSCMVAWEDWVSTVHGQQNKRICHWIAGLGHPFKGRAFWYVERCKCSLVRTPGVAFAGADDFARKCDLVHALCALQHSCWPILDRKQPALEAMHFPFHAAVASSSQQIYIICIDHNNGSSQPSKNSLAPTYAL
jgi:hypothetical protein